MPLPMVRGGISFLLALGALVVACSAAPAKADKLCTPDANVFCRCVDRQEGTKKCKEDGASFEACLPCDGSGDKGAGSDGTDGLGAGHGTDSEESQTRNKRTEDDANPADEGDNAKDPPKKDAGAPPASSSGEDPPPTGSTTSSSGTTTTPKRDAGSSSGSSGSSGTAPDQTTSFPDTTHCKPLKNIAPKIELQKIADDPTPAKGGQPADGLYVQSWVIEFTGEDGESGPTKHYSKETLEIGGDVGRYVFEDEDGTTTHGGFRLSKSDDAANKVNVAYECPATAPKDLAYDATDSSITIYDGKYARVFIRQKEAK